MVERNNRAGVALVLAAALFVAGEALAQGPPADPFTVFGVAVDVTGASIGQAREAALAEGPRKAFRQLIAKLVPTDSQARAPTPSDANLQALIGGFAIAEERASAVRYIANLTYQFKADSIRTMLRGARIPFAETLSRTVLVVPALQTKEGVALWNETNPWRDAWARLAPGNGLIPWAVPLGDGADIAALRQDDAPAADDATLNAFGRRYGATVMLALAVVPADAPVPSVKIMARRVGGARYEADLTAADGETLDAVLERAAATIMERAEDDWKRGNVLRFDRGDRLEVRVAIASLADLEAVRQRLAQVPQIRRSEVRELSRREARMELQFVGDTEQLRVALAQIDLELSGEGDFELRLGASATGRNR